MLCIKKRFLMTGMPTENTRLKGKKGKKQMGRRTWLRRIQMHQISAFGKSYQVSKVQVYTLEA